MPYDTRQQSEVRYYLTLLQDCFVVWMETMDKVLHEGETRLTHRRVIEAIEPIAIAQRRLGQYTVSNEMMFAHRTTLALLQSAMKALHAIAYGAGTPAIREMSEQLTIFEYELCRLAEVVGFTDMKP